ncbi:MAG: hypothetical protein GX879_09410 [Bacteroidales bacterium]|nr:hypothetical protein [Bacteroidales bacterium]
MNITKVFFVFLFLLAFSISLTAQTFTLREIKEIETLNGDELYNYFGRIKCNTQSIILLSPEFNDNYEYVDFLIIDSSYNANIYSWKSEKNHIWGDNVEIIDGICVSENKFLILTQYYLYYLRLKKDKLKTQGKIKLSQNYDNQFNSIYFLGDKPTKYALLANTYNHLRSDQLHDVFRIAKFNLKSKKIEKTVNINMGKGIFLSHYSYQMISTTEEHIAIANPYKPEIYLFDNQLNFIDTVFINYPEIYTTQIFLDSLLTDEFIKENKPGGHNIIEYLNDNDIYSRPRILKIAFINKDLLFVLVQPKIDRKSSDWSKYKLHYIYSISDKSFYKDEGFYSYYSHINSSQPLLFVNNSAISMTDSVDSNNKFKYYALINELAIDFKAKYYEIIKYSALPKFSELQAFDSLDINLNYQDFQYIILTDYMACSHCRFGDSLKNLLVIHTYNQNVKMDKSGQLAYIKKYNQMFDEPKVLFCPISLIDLNLLKLNNIYSSK